MRALLCLLPLLAAADALADCRSRVLLQVQGSLVEASVDGRSLYYSLEYPARSILRFDEVTGHTSTFIALGEPATQWQVENSTLAYFTASSYVVIGPDGARHAIALPAPGRYKVRDGYLYWFDGQIRRQSVNGGAIESFAVPAPQGYVDFEIVEDRLVYRDDRGLYAQRLDDAAAPVQLLAHSGLSINEATRDAIFVSTTPPPPVSFPPYVSTSAVIRVPWAGVPAETIYEASRGDPKAEVSVFAIVRGATLYIVRRESSQFQFLTTTLFLMRDGVADQRYRAMTGWSVYVVSADEESVVLLEQLGAENWRFVRVCAESRRTRAAAH
jgi:hypothetical protein